MTPQADERRMLVILWAAMAASIVMYFVVIRMVQPTHAQDNPALVNGLLIAAVVLVGSSFPLKSRLRSIQPERTAMLVALAMCETAALCGLIVWFSTAWPYYYLFLLLGLVGQLAHFPAGQDRP